MRWYVPSWNGDLRMSPHKKHPDRTVITIEKPTPAEQKALNEIAAECVNAGYLKEWEPFKASAGFFSPSKWEFEVDASLEKLGPIVATILRPGSAVLTAIRFSDGEVVTCSGGRADLQQMVETAYRSAPAALPAPPDPPPAAEAKPEDPKPKEPDPPKPEAAVTVKRHTPCCPNCIPGAIHPATEVLLAFLNEEEHRSWSKTRSIVVTGGLSGCRYRLAHRHSPIGQRQGRICWDLDHDHVVHFHDWTVPPEEEVLAAKLILEHREPWLRNEATYFDSLHQDMIFKNPFGGVSDGAADSAFTARLGRVLANIIRPPIPPKRLPS